MNFWDWYDRKILGKCNHIYQFREFKFYCKECKQIE